MAHLTGIGIENFRVFKDYTEFDFAPITILTGANNSGKSSVLKALLLFNDNAKKNGLQELDFKIQGQQHNLGDWEFAKNNQGEEKEISFNFKFINHFSSFISGLKIKEVDFIYNTRISYFFENNSSIGVKNLSFSSGNKEFLKYGARSIANTNLKIFIKNFLEKKEVYELLEYYDKVSFNAIKDIDLEAIIKLDKFQSVKELTNFEAFYQLLIDETIRLSSEVRIGTDLNLYAVLGNYDYDRTGQNIFLSINQIFDKEDYTLRYDTILQVCGELKWLHILDDTFLKFIKLINSFIGSSLKSIQEVSISYLPPIRANTQRLYTYQSQGTGFNELLVQYLDSNLYNGSIQKHFIDKWINIFGLGDSIDFSKGHIKGIGTQIQIFKNGKELNLADLGFGVTQLIPLLMKIAICGTEYLLLEEPENSLHPNLQAKLADMFIDAHRTFGINFIIETHSEYLIRKLQYLTAKKEIKPEDTAIYYFYNPEQERPKDKKQVERIKIQEDGRLDGDFGEGFFDEASQLISLLWQTQLQN